MNTPTPSSRQRTFEFLAGGPVDRPPFHPIVMRFAARHAGVKYRDFCLNPADKCRAMIRCAEDFDADWVTVMSDPYAEAEAFGIKVEYREDDLPLDQGHFADIVDVDHLVPSLEPFVHLLSPGQVFSGKADPVSVIQNGTSEAVLPVALGDFREAGGRCILSGGCEITPGTAPENLRSLARAAAELRFTS
ncbi:MAG: hypothetical protein J0M04_06715 [Verrucomicrobia bacterium]|nr:hypothetical protein [Verrucomicrobiota bacterium]